MTQCRPFLGILSFSSGFLGNFFKKYPIYAPIIPFFILRRGNKGMLSYLCVQIFLDFAYFMSALQRYSNKKVF